MASPTICLPQRPPSPPEHAFDGKLLLLAVPVQSYFETGRVIQNIWKYSMQRCLVRRNTTAHPRPVAIFADEAHYFLSSYDPTFLSVARRARCAVMMLTQNISQVIEKLGSEEKAHSLLGNFTTKIAP